MANLLRMSVLTVLLGSLSVSCSHRSTATGAAVAAAVASALVYKGAVVAPADVAIHAIRPTGALGEELARTQTDNGRVDVEIPYRGAIAFVVTGGQFRDFRGVTSSIPVDKPMLGLGWADPNRSPRYTVSPLSHFIFCIMQTYARDADTKLDTAMYNADMDIARLIGWPGQSVLTLGINDLSITQSPGPETDHSFAIAAICEYAIQFSRDFMTLVTMMGLDLKDRIPDGLFCGQPILDSTGTPLELDAFKVVMVTSILSFLQSSFNGTGLGAGGTNTINGFQNYSFPAPAYIRTIRNGTVRRGEPTSLIDVWGSFGPASALTVWLNGFPIPPGSVSDLLGGGFRVSIDESWIQDIFGYKTSASLAVEDASTSYKGYWRRAAHLVDPTVRPTLDGVQLETVPTVGGSHSLIYGRNFDRSTEFLFNQVPARQIYVQPDGRAAMVSVPPGSPGFADVEARNGSEFALAANAVEYSDLEVALRYTPTGLSPQVNLGFRVRDDDAEGLKVDLYSNVANWTSEESGQVANHDQVTASELNPTPTRQSISNATASRNRVGVTGRLRFQEPASGLDLSARYVEGVDARYGLEEKGFYVGFDRPTSFAVDDIARKYGFKTLQWNFVTSQYREIVGISEFGKDGIASFNGEARSVNWKTGALAKDEYIASYRYQVGSDGAFDLQPLRTGSTTVDVTGYFSPEGKSYYYSGIVGDWTISSVAGSLRSGRTNESLVGYRQGPRVSTAVEDNGGPEARIDYQWDYGVWSLVDNYLARLRVEEGVSRAQSDTEEFATTAGSATRLVSPGGIVRDDADAVVGFITSSVRYDIGGGTLGATVRVPALLTKDSLWGSYLGVAQGFNYDDPASPGSPAETIQSALFKTDFQSGNAATVNGIPFDLAATKSSTYDLKVTRRSSGSVSSVVMEDVASNDTTIYLGNYDRIWTIVTDIDPQSPLAGNQTPHVFASGHVAWDGMDGTFSSASGSIAGTEYFVRPNPFGEMRLNGHYHLGALGNRYDPTSFERFSSIRQGGFGTSGFNFRTDMTFDYSGSGTEIGEGGSARTSTFAGTGTYGWDLDGFLNLSVSGRTYRGLNSPNLEFFRLIDFTEDADDGDLYGVLFSQMTPADVTFRLDGALHEFSADPRHETTQIRARMTLNRPGQLNYVGYNVTRNNVDPYDRAEALLSSLLQTTFSDGFVSGTFTPRTGDFPTSFEGATSPSSSYGLNRFADPASRRIFMGIRARY